MDRCECFVDRPDVGPKAGGRCLCEAVGKYEMVDMKHTVHLCLHCVLDALDRGRTVRKVIHA